MPRSPLLLLPVLLFSSLVAKADTIFNASGVFTDGSVLSGTLTIDTTTGSITGSNLTVTGASNYTFVDIVNQSYTQVPGVYNVGDRNAAGTEDFNFYLPDVAQTALTGYMGGRFCSNLAPCSYGSGLYNLTTHSNGVSLELGSLVASTPEPSSMLLLGTGVLGMAGSLKRRLSA